MPSCVIVCQYYYPDDGVSSRHYTDLAEGLHLKGWSVDVYTGNRYYRKKGIISPCNEIRNGVHIKRFKYPAFSHSDNIGRLLNTFFLSIKWFFSLLYKQSDVIIFCTNPQFSYFAIPFLSFFRPSLPITIWGFDLYPEAIVADGIKIPGFILRILKWWAGISYRRCGLLVDIGSCMRKRFLAYHPNAKYETIIPWAFNEPNIFM